MNKEQEERDNVIPFERPKLATAGSGIPYGPNWLKQLVEGTVFLVKSKSRQDQYILIKFKVFEIYEHCYRLHTEENDKEHYLFVDTNRFSNAFDLVEILGYSKE